MRRKGNRHKPGSAHGPCRRLRQPQHTSAQAKLATGRARAEKEIWPGPSPAGGAGGACAALHPPQDTPPFNCFSKRGTWRQQLLIFL